MKFFHISDLHIGKQLHYYSLKEDQEAILNEIVQYAENLNPKAIVIAGDVYDKSVPSAEAVAVFDTFVRKLSEHSIEILVISGNHDSPERLEFASTLLEKQHLHMAGLPPLGPEDHLKKVTLSDEFGDVHFYLLPFLKPGYVRRVFEGEKELTDTETVRKLLEREKIDKKERNVLVTHQFYTSSGREPERSDSESVFVGGAGNVDVSAVSSFDYVAMGHIHKSQNVGDERFRYCGTPLKYSVGESKDSKTLTVVTLGEKGAAPFIETFPLHPVRDVRQFQGKMEDLLKMGCSDYASVTMTDDKIPYQAREQLNRVFPNLLELRVENTHTRHSLLEMPDAQAEKSPMELFEMFYEEINGKRMSEEERNIISSIICEAEVEGR